MEYEISPEPTADEREALARALAELLDDDAHPAYGSGWRHAAIVENTGVFRLCDGALAE